jgi:Uma2 family endonuclease
MTFTLNDPPLTDEIIYPSGDGEPLAESYEHVKAIAYTLDVLTRYLAGQRATVLADQFLYYAQGFPRLRVAPDVMVIFDVAPGGRDSYKLWEEGEVPDVIFEMTSASTQQQDQVLKKNLYEQLGVQEYWLFDPKGDYLPQPLMGYRLQYDAYHPIAELKSEVLGLWMEADGALLNFYREDNGEKLLISTELEAKLEEANQQLQQEHQRAEQEHQRAEQEHQRAERLVAKLKALGIEEGED